MGEICRKVSKLCLLAVAAGIFFTAGGAAAQGTSGRMPAGTSVGGVDVSGLRLGEACAAVGEALRHELD